MNYLKLCYAIFLLYVMFACSSKTNRVEEGDICIIDYSSLKKCELDDFFKNKRCEYVLLNDSSEKSLFGRPDKIEIQNGYIYIADQRMRVLAVYDINGKVVTSVGRRGQGPAEYVNLTDFDVDSVGNICILDGRLDKLLFYDSNFQFIREKALPFEADIIQFVQHGKMLCGLSSWNRGEHEGDKIVMTDIDMNVMNTFLQYDKYVDPAYWISNYQFAKSEDYVAYNQTINDDIIVFTHSGVWKEIIRFDFGDKAVPDEYKINIEPKLSDFDNFCMLKKIYAVTDKYVIGTLWEYRKTKMFIVDRALKVCYLSDEIAPMDLNFVCGYCKKGIVSNLIETNEMYPDSVNNHLISEKAVLKIQSVN
ncbi:6-bladed beta-propeller [Bacteroides eggerthii]|uniref:6-bladed beta-propeller n=1 Tax=Bacteroides eggerthii TaxID=28111 RepID=UPI00321B30F9